MAQEKELVDQRHKITMTKLVVCFDRERGTMSDIRKNSLSHIIRK